MQTVALFGLNLQRIPGLIGAASFLILSVLPKCCNNCNTHGQFYSSSALVIPHRASWYRSTFLTSIMAPICSDRAQDIINFLAFQGFLLYMHFQRDMVRSPPSI